jgi:hypothetical protein
MVPSRKDTIDAIVKALQPSNLPPKELTSEIAKLLALKVEVDSEIDIILANENSRKFSRKQMRKQGDEFIDLTQRMLNCVETMDAEYRSAMIYSLEKNGVVGLSKFQDMLRDLAYMVESRRKFYSPKRSGGNSELREDMAGKRRHAEFACRLILMFQKADKLTPGYKPYLDITRALIAHFEPGENTDPTRACEQVYRVWYLDEHNDWLTDKQS